MSFLDEMAACSRERLAQARQRRPLSQLQADLHSAPPVRALNSPPFLLIAELKRSSPALGRLDDNSPITPRIHAYTQGGAAAISILTEPTRFNGTLDDLSTAAAATHLPVMRKDFLIDPYQVAEARAAGASGILLIVRMLSDQQLADMLHAAAELTMFTLIEVFDQHDAQRAGPAAALAPTARLLIGVNIRDLATLTVHPQRLLDLRKALPPGLPAIAESGMQTPEDVARAAQWGYDGALVGGGLMRAPDPEHLCRDMVRAGVAARRQP